MAMSSTAVFALDSIHEILAVGVVDLFYFVEFRHPKEKSSTTAEQQEQPQNAQDDKEELILRSFRIFPPMTPRNFQA